MFSNVLDNLIKQIVNKGKTNNNNYYYTVTIDERAYQCGDQYTLYTQFYIVNNSECLLAISLLIIYILT